MSVVLTFDDVEALSAARANERLTMGRHGKRAVIVDASKYRRAKRAIAAAFEAQYPHGAPMDGPVCVGIYMRWPRRHVTRKGGPHPAKGLARIDVDSLAKCLLDALERAGVVHDDAQVQGLQVGKVYDKANPGVVVVVSSAHEGTEGPPPVH